MVRVGVFGAGGRMGSTVCRAVADDPDLELVAAVDPYHAGIDLAQLGLPGTGVQVSANADALAHAGAEVAVDFTVVEAARDNMRWCAENGVHVVVGTTGFSREDLADLEARFHESTANAVVAPNFAIGAVLMMRLAEVASPYFESAEVIEAHAQTKLDAPSGTALATARRLAAARREPFAYARPETVTLEHTRGGEEGSVGVHSLRLPGVVADQEIIFGAQGQTLTIAHRTTSREAFMPGVLATIRAVVAEPRFYRTLDEVLGLPALKDGD